MTEGKIVGICISVEHGKVPNLVSSVNAIPGKGLENDRYFSQKDEGDKNEQELTLIESEKIFDFNKKFSTNFEIVEFRRNIIKQFRFYSTLKFSILVLLDIVFFYI